MAKEIEKAAANQMDRVRRGFDLDFWWLALALTALATRLAGAFFFPNAEQDGYSDAETIARFSHGIAHGAFRLTDLYGFWLPLFQLGAAVLNLVIHNALLAGKILSGVCGALSCLLAASISLRLTSSRVIASLVFALVLSSPIHFIYSSACMTDVPFGCLMLAALLCVFDDRWTGAFVFAAVAGAVRVEGWVLIPLLPLLQFARQRRITWTAILPLLPVLLWFCVTYLARGHWLAFFDDRVLYHDHYIEFHPTRRGFAWSDVGMDADNLLFGANRVAFFAVPIAGCLLVFDKIRARAEAWKVFVAFSFFAAILGFLVLGYVTKRQPVWLPRYGLFALVIGAPLLGWIIQVVRQNLGSTRMINIAMAIALVGLCLWEVRRQYSIVPKILGDFAAHSKIATTLASDKDRSAIRCLCDDVSVRVLSGLPEEQFLRSSDVPRTAWQDLADFERFQQERRMNYLVLMPTEDSLPAKWYWSRERGSTVPGRRFELVVSAESDFGPAVWLYRARP